MNKALQIPAGWKEKRLKDVGKCLTGLTYTPKDVTDDSGLLVLRSSNVQGGKLVFDDNVYVKRDVNVKNYTQSGDILVCVRNGSSNLIGKNAIVTADGNGLPHGAFMMLFRSKHYQYLYQLFSSEMYNKQVYRNLGATINSINSSDFYKFRFLFPPLPEQKAIAALLSTWDEAIEKTERLIQVKEKQLDAYARDLFDRKNDGKYEGWKVVKLKTVLNEHGNKSTGTEEVYSVSVHKGLVNQVEHLGRSFAAANTDNYNRVHYGDIVYTKSPTGDFPLGIVKQSYAKEDVIVSPLYGVFTPRTFYLGIVLNFYFSSPARARNYLFPIVQKGAKNTIAITNKTFLSKALHLPVEEKAQKAVAEFVYAAREEIDLLKHLADKYKTQKRGLMQKMLTGEWRVKPEIINQYMEA